jgi:hypothetical protein
VHGIDDGTLRAFFYKQQELDWSGFSVCENGGYRPATREELRRRKLETQTN